MSVFSNWLQSAIDNEPNWDQAELARQLQVKDSLVSKWLHDQAKPSRRMTTKLCVVFKVSPEFLLPLIDYRDVIALTPPQERNKKRAELLARLPSLVRLLEAIMELPLEKQATYLELASNLLPGLVPKAPKGEEGSLPPKE